MPRESSFFSLCVLLPERSDRFPISLTEPGKLAINELTVRTGTPVSALTLALLILTATLGPVVPVVGGVVQTGPLTWSPFGPRTRNLMMTVYGDFSAMFDAFLNGEVDITDWPVQVADESSFGNNSDIFMTQGVEELGIFQLDINHHNTFLGIPLQETRGSDAFNSPSTRQPTTTGIEIRKAIAHLLDKPSFIQGAQLLGRASFTDIQAPPGHGISIGGAFPSKLPANVLAEDCAAHPWFAPCDTSHPPVSAYNLVPDALADPFNSFQNLGYSGTADLRAACDHLVLAGFTITPADSGCLDVAMANGGAHLVPNGHVIFYIRSHPPRRAFGGIIRDALNFLFGTPGLNNPNCTVLHGSGCFEYYFTITEISDIVLRTEPDRDDWHLYTGGWFLGSIPDHLYVLYHSQFASSVCGGEKSTFAENFHFYCSPDFDQEASAGQIAASLGEASAHFANAALIAHRQVMTVPVYSGAGTRFVSLNGWDGLVPVLGRGFYGGFGFWSFLNMRQRPSYMPADPKYTPGGGNLDLIRRGFSQAVRNLSPFQAATFWEFEVLDQIYDTMLKPNPLTGGVGQQLIDWMTVRHISSFDPNEAFASVTGVTTQTWVLRNDLRWHDGVPVTADDVVYSIAASSLLCFSLQGPCPPSPSSRALDSRTVEVKLTGQSIFHELNIGGLPIIPKHIWAPLCGDPVSTTSVCADPAFDPMAAGIMIGSGPWVCKNQDTGAVGGSCIRDAGGNLSGQQVNPGGEILLTAYDGYHRGRPGVADSSLHKFSWADRNNDARVDILDIADVAFRFGGLDPYWNTGQNSVAPQTVGSDAARVDIAEVATVAFYFGHGLVTPLTPSVLTGLDPDIDPFF